MKKLLFLLGFLASCNADEAPINGYIEGEYVYISPSSAGILDEIFVVKGQEIKANDRLFSVDTITTQAEVDSAKTSLEKSYSNYANLTKGKRPEEILAILKQKDQASAVLTNATKELDRTQKLAKTGYSSKADLDSRTADYKQAKGQVDEINANLKTAMLGAREDEVKMAISDIEIARQNLTKAEKKFSDNHPTAKLSGKVEDVYYRLGETVNAGSPVINILPPENVKARFFVSQKLLPKFQLGKELLIACDGCEKPIPATISFVSSQAEFTPPVIYSIESREKLVFMIEATPKEFSPLLHPGLPIDIRLEE